MDSQRQFGALLTIAVKSLFEEGIPTDADTLKQQIYPDIEAATPGGVYVCCMVVVVDVRVVML